MEKKVSIRDIAKLHVSQQLERKKAILLNLELDTWKRVDSDSGDFYVGRSKTL